MASMAKGSSIPLHEPAPWDSHKAANGAACAKHNLSNSDLLLQCSDSESLHNCLRWPCAHFGLFAKHHPHAGFRGWLHASLDAAHARDGEDTCALYFLCGNGHEAAEHLRTNLLLQAMLSCERLGHGPFGHCLSASLHRLHGRQHGEEWMKQMMRNSELRME